MKAKERHRRNLLKYLGNPENDFINRTKMYTEVLGIKKETFYWHFTPDEVTQIEADALEIRKNRSARQRANVLDSLYKRANGFSHPDVHITNYQGEITVTDIVKHYPPDKPAAQEFLDRTEGKVVEKKEITGKDGNAIETKSTMEAGPGISGVLQALERATSGRQDNCNEEGDKE